MGRNRLLLQTRTQVPNTWDRLAEIAGHHPGKGQQVAIDGRLQTRSWDDERGAQRFWITRNADDHGRGDEPDGARRALLRRGLFGLVAPTL